MLQAFTILLVCQTAGEALVRATGAPVPGPVAGMVLLFAGLTAYGRVPDELGKLGDGLLSHLSLLFVPAGVGVMLHAGLIGRDWLPISLALVVSTVVTIVVTATAMRLLAKRGPAEPTAKEH